MNDPASVPPSDPYTSYGVMVKLRPEHPLTDRALEVRASYERGAPQPPLFLAMHTATLGALLAEWSRLDPEASLESNYLFGLRIAADDTMALGMIQASR